MGHNNNIHLINLGNILKGFLAPHIVQDMDEMLEEFNKEAQQYTKKQNSGYPVTNAWYNKEKKFYIVEMSVAGWDEKLVKEGISFDSEKMVLTIDIKNNLSEEEKLNKEEEESNRIYIEQRLPKRDIYREYSFEQNVELDGIDINVENGILTIVFYEKKRESKKIPLNFLENNSKEV